MQLNRSLLSFSDEAWQLPTELHSCWNARGSYSPLQFVLRLRPDVHAELESAGTDIKAAGDFTFSQVQAFSTYLHETIHWWQHVGSTLGLSLTLLQPAHAHYNRNRLLETISQVGALKSLKRLNRLQADGAEGYALARDSVNVVLNNWHDLEFFRRLTIDPERPEPTVRNEYFECVGHSYHMTAAVTTWLISSTVDPTLAVLPDPRIWESKFRRLKEKKVEAFYFGSPISLPPLGAREIFEGQARLSQIQYLYGSSGGRLSWDDFSKLGMLDGIYREGFDQFLKLVDRGWPAKPDDPLVGLFLLICDLAVNPTEGLFEPIPTYETFVWSTDPGLRFLSLCVAARRLEPTTLGAIAQYSADEYWDVSEMLCKGIVATSPRRLAEKVVTWGANHDGWKTLIEEDRTFNFKPVNLPVRLFLAKFLRFQADKLAFPQFFCWPGIWASSCRNGSPDLAQGMALINEHGALFVDKPDGDVYPRILPGRDEQAVHKTFNDFYSWVSTYELARQWIVADGAFDYNFFWLSSKHSSDQMKAWADHNFELSFGVHPDSFRVLPS